MTALPRGWVSTPLDSVCLINPRDVGNLSADTLVSFVPMPSVSDIEGTINEHGSRPFFDVSKGYTRFGSSRFLVEVKGKYHSSGRPRVRILRAR